MKAFRYIISSFAALTIFLPTLSAQEVLDSLLGGAQHDSMQVVGNVLSSDESSQELMTWNRANDAYARGEYRSAIAGYNSLLASGLESSKLYYNLGNAYFKCDSLARAILSYNRALKLDPSDEDAAYNLGIAESRTVNRIDKLPEFFMAEWFRNLSHIFSSDGWALLSIIFFALAICGAGYYLLTSTVGGRKIGFTVSVVSLVFFIVSVSISTTQKHNKLSSGEGIVMVSAAAVKSSPNISGKDLFVLNEGAFVTLGEQVGSWRQITIASGDKGWIESSQIEEI